MTAPTRFEGWPICDLIHEAEHAINTDLHSRLVECLKEFIKREEERLQHRASLRVHDQTPRRR